MGSIQMTVPMAPLNENCLAAETIRIAVGPCCTGLLIHRP